MILFSFDLVWDQRSCMFMFHHMHVVYLPAFVCIYSMPLLSLSSIDISYFGVTRPFLKGAAGKQPLFGASEAH